MTKRAKKKTTANLCAILTRHAIAVINSLQDIDIITERKDEPAP